MNQENSKEIISIIQARMSSKRLPGKVLFKLGNSTILNEVINRAKTFSKQVIVCTSTHKSDDYIQNYCLEKDILFFRGELENVFLRYQNVFGLRQIQNCTWFARVTADNPLISKKLAKNLISKIDSNLDYIAYKNNIPNGSGIELINRNTFINIDSDRLDNIQKEHVTPIFYENPDMYNILLLNPPDFYNLNNLRITIDYQEDYQLLKKLFLINNSISLEEVIEIYNNEPDFFKINKNCIQKKVR